MKSINHIFSCCIFFAFFSYFSLLLVGATHPTQKELPAAESSERSCPVPTERQLRCLREWACQHVIRLDLRCLLTLNGNPLLSSLLGLTGSGDNIGDGTVGGLLANLLGG